MSRAVPVRQLLSKSATQKVSTGANVPPQPAQLLLRQTITAVGLQFWRWRPPVCLPCQMGQPEMWRNLPPENLPEVELQMGLGTPCRLVRHAAWAVAGQVGAHAAAHLQECKRQGWSTERGPGNVLMHVEAMP